MYVYAVYAGWWIVRRLWSGLSGGHPGVDPVMQVGWMRLCGLINRSKHSHHYWGQCDRTVAIQTGHGRLFFGNWNDDGCLEASGYCGSTERDAEDVC